MEPRTPTAARGRNFDPFARRKARNAGCGTALIFALTSILLVGLLVFVVVAAFNLALSL